ncbi:hypothetical protein QBC38DRAFT_489716 [Podospora fimiseda]|uniref:Transmembrane protein n=1 Tax=Podospora fimiseda TaxID=252190 RepID=A0AAN6YNR5_9PEZI|nr:hypothetical protein QBC38DRAFT_489716 [Podospora fimiseda]
MEQGTVPDYFPTLGYSYSNTADWVISIAGIILSIAVLVFSIGGLVRPVYFNKNRKVNPSKRLSAPLKWIVFALVCSIIRCGIRFADLLPFGHSFFEIHNLEEAFNLTTECIAFISVLRITRRFKSAPAAESDLSVGTAEQGKPEPSDGAADDFVCEKNIWDILLMTLMPTLALTYWATYLGLVLRLLHGKPFERPEIMGDVVQGIQITYRAVLVLGSFYITWRLLSKRRKGPKYSTSASPSDLNARVTFTLKVIPTMVFISIVVMINTVVFGFADRQSLFENYRATEALSVMFLLATMIGEVLLLEFCRGALRRLSEGK